jgi:hypothetical protein
MFAVFLQIVKVAAEANKKKWLVLLITKKLFTHQFDSDTISGDM